MNYSISILRQAQKVLARLPQNSYERVRDAIFSLKQNPRPYGCLKLTEREGWRIRIGDYRVIYDIDDDNKIITILDIGSRQNIYR